MTRDTLSTRVREVLRSSQYPELSIREIADRVGEPGYKIVTAVENVDDVVYDDGRGAVFLEENAPEDDGLEALNHG